MIKELDSILYELESKGSNKDELSKLKKKLIPILNQNKDLEIIIKDIVDKIVFETKKFLNLKNKDDINYNTGFSSSIYLPSFDGSGEIDILLTGGYGSREKENFKITSNTKFDIASITKLFTLILVLKLNEEGIINLNDKIVDIDPNYKGLEDYTINDLIRMHGILYTDCKISSAHNSKEAYTILKSVYLKDNSRKKNKYNDYGAIIVGKIIEKIISEKAGKKRNLDDIMHEYIFNKVGMFETKFNPIDDNISGNGGYNNLVHDPNTQLLDGITGSAGIFTTSRDLNKLAKALFSVNYNESGLISKSSLKKLGEITFPRSKQCGKGNLGVYVKNPLGYAKTFTPSIFSTDSFSHQGWTGAIAYFDPNNFIHFNFLPNAILKEDKKYIIHDKPKGYIDAFIDYSDFIIKHIMIIYIIKKYYNIYKNQDIELKEKIII